MADYDDWTESMELLGTEIMLPVDLQAQYLTLEIDIVAQSVGDIAIDIASQSVGNISVNIAAQDADVTINIKAQTVGVYLQPEWQAKADKLWTLRSAGAVSANTYSTILLGTVPTGKTYYVTDVSVMATYNPARLGAYFYKVVNSTVYPICQAGGDCGTSEQIRTPMVIPAGGQLTLELWNLESEERNFAWCARGYYEDD